MSAIFIATKLRGTSRYIKYTLEEQDEEDFQTSFVDTLVHKALVAHNIEAEEEISVDFYDNNKTPIPSEDLFDICSQKVGSGCFCVEIKVFGDLTKTITSEQLRRFFLGNQDGQSIFDEFNRTKQLGKKIRIKVINYLAKMIEEEYGGEASRAEIELICQATIELFPVLADTNGGTTLLYTGSSGYLYEKLRNKSRKQGKEDKNIQDVNDNPVNENISSDELMQYFKNCVVAQDRENLMKRLESSVEYRRMILKNPHEHIYKLFPFYFVDPELILFDFELLFRNIDAHALTNIWPTLKSKAPDFFKIGDDITVPTKDSVVLDFLCVLNHLLPKRTTLKNVIKDFIKFIENPNADPVELIESNYAHPFIICVVSNINEPAMKYYIGMQDRIFSVPITFNFVQVMDLFFKIHKVFNVDFHSKIKQLLTLVDHFIFKFPPATMRSITTTMQEVANKLFTN